MYVCLCLCMRVFVCIPVSVNELGCVSEMIRKRFIVYSGIRTEWRERSLNGAEIGHITRWVPWSSWKRSEDAVMERATFNANQLVAYADEQNPGPQSNFLCHLPAEKKKDKNETKKQERRKKKGRVKERRIHGRIHYLEFNCRWMTTLEQTNTHKLS